MTSSAFTQKRMSTKRKSPEDDRASEAFHPHYYAGESRVYAYTPIIAAASSRYAARPGAAARRGNRRRRGSASTPSVASRRGAFTRSGAGGSLNVGSAGT